jgi:DNA polymerase-4
MFEDTPEMISLYNAMDNIRKRFGKKAIRRAVGMNW